jgi:hypothetical protein
LTLLGLRFLVRRYRHCDKPVPAFLQSDSQLQLLL